MAEVPFTNLLMYVAVAAAPTLVVWAALKVPRLIRRLRHPIQAPEHPPIQTIAADLRRVRRLLGQFAPGTPAIRRIGARQAYDALLVQACAAVGVDHRLDVLPEGVDREIERLRVEESLRTAGLVIP